MRGEEEWRDVVEQENPGLQEKINAPFSHKK